MVAITIILLEGRVVELFIEVRVGKKIMDEGARISEPHIKFSCHPSRYIGDRSFTIVLYTETLPRYVSKGCCINSFIQMIM